MGFHHSSSLFQGLAEAIADATRLFTSRRRPSGIDLLERETNRIRLESRHWLM
jgi:hypothetical protein